MGTWYVLDTASHILNAFAFNFLKNSMCKYYYSHFEGYEPNNSRFRGVNYNAQDHIANSAVEIQMHFQKTDFILGTF